VEQEVPDADLAHHDNLFYDLTLRHLIDFYGLFCRKTGLHVPEIFATIASNQSYLRLRHCA